MRPCDTQGGADLPYFFLPSFWSEYIREKASVSKPLLYLNVLILNQNRITLKESKPLCAALKQPEQEVWKEVPCSPTALALEGLSFPLVLLCNLISFGGFLVVTSSVVSGSLGIFLFFSHTLGFTSSSDSCCKNAILLNETFECCLSPELLFLFMFSWWEGRDFSPSYNTRCFLMFSKGKANRCLCFLAIPFLIE